MSFHSVCLKAFAIGLVVLGCGSSTPKPDAGSDAGNACAGYAATYCNFLNACQPGALQADYGTVATCDTMRTLDCTTNMAASGSGLTPSFLTACGASFTSQASACSTKPVPSAVETPNDACALVGNGMGGTACGVDAQCATDDCNRVGTVCGTCTAPGILGEGCDLATGVTCPRGMTCSGYNSTCVTTVGLNASCDLGVTTACVAGATCVIAAMGDTGGTCQASGAAVGVACNAQGIAAPGCWADAGFYCNSTTNQCAAITYAAPAATCGLANPATSDTQCLDGACLTTGTCAAHPTAGQACTFDADPTCTDGNVCVSGGAAGTCTAVTSTCNSTAVTANFTFQPSNVSLTAIDQVAAMAVDENVSSSCSIGTDATSPDTDCFTSPITAIKQPGGTTINLIVVRSLEVQTGAIISVGGGVPLVIISLSDVIWYGQLAANSSGLDVGPGGGAGAGSNVVGPGAGGGLAGSGSSKVGGGGGSFCGIGGAGGGTANASMAYGEADNRPLAGGSAGGGGAVGSGAGGGGVQIVAAGVLLMKAGSSITVGGGGGPEGGLATDQNAGGGGSGGAILLEAQTVTFNGILAANGGGGGGDYANTAGDATANSTPAAGGAGGTSDAAGGNGSAAANVNGAVGTAATSGNGGSGGGGGAAGWIRINTVTGTSGGNGVYSPASTTPCTTHGMVRALGTGA